MADNNSSDLSNGANRYEIPWAIGRDSVYFEELGDNDLYAASTEFVRPLDDAKAKLLAAADVLHVLEGFLTKDSTDYDGMAAHTVVAEARKLINDAYGCADGWDSSVTNLFINYFEQKEEKKPRKPSGDAALRAATSSNEETAEENDDTH